MLKSNEVYSINFKLYKDVKGDIQLKQREFLTVAKIWGRDRIELLEEFIKLLEEDKHLK